MSPEYEVKVILNVPRDQAEYLYDEIEGLLTVGIETAVERTSGSDRDRLERVISASALTRYLSESLKNPAIFVEKVQIWPDHMMMKENIGVKINVPLEWAITYGNVDDRLAETIDFLTDTEEEEEIEEEPAKSVQSLAPKINRGPYTIGMIQYDQLSHQMKVWTGMAWEPVA